MGKTRGLLCMGEEIGEEEKKRKREGDTLAVGRKGGKKRGRFLYKGFWA